MVGHNPQGYVRLMVLLVLGVSQLADPVKKRLVGVHGEQGVHALDHDGQAL